MLKTDGNRIMEIFKEKPGQKIGWTLNALLEEVLDDPKKNELGYLDARTVDLLKMSDDALRELGESGKKKREEKEEKELNEIMEKYHVC